MQKCLDLPPPLLCNGITFTLAKKSTKLLFDIFYRGIQQKIEMNVFLEDTLDLVQGLTNADCDCSVYYFYGTCEHVNKTLMLVDNTDDEDSFSFFAGR